MNFEEIIMKKRSLDLAVKNHNNNALIRLNIFLENYYENVKVCEHDCYCNYGYYKYSNGDIYLTDRENAEFRVLICANCNEKITLLKTDDPNWDIKLGNSLIDIKNPFTLQENGISSEILTQSLNLIMYPFFNSKQHYCGHLEFVNNGYFSLNNKKIIKSCEEMCDFRVVTCLECKETYLLPKNEEKYWNSTIDGNAISVYPNIKKKKLCR